MMNTSMFILYTYIVHIGKTMVLIVFSKEDSFMSLIDQTEDFQYAIRIC